jgi:hypothetical protein
MQHFMGKHVALHFSKVRGMKRVSVQGIILAVCCFAAAPCAGQQVQSAATPVAATLPPAPPLPQAERRLAKARLLSELMSPPDVTIEATVSNIASGFRLGFQALTENHALASQYPGVDDAVVRAVQPRARLLVQAEQEPFHVAAAQYLADQFTITELDQGIRLYRHPLMVKLVRTSIAELRNVSTAQNLKTQLEKGSRDPKLLVDSVRLDSNRSVQRAVSRMTSAEVRALAPLLQSEFAEKLQRIRPRIDQMVIELARKSAERVSADEELRTLAVVAMAEFIAKADAAKPAVSAAITPPAK